MIAGRCALERVIARDCCALVWRVRCDQREAVAEERVGTDPLEVQRDLQRWAGVRHPGLVAVEAAEATDRGCLVVREPLQGATLAETLAGHGPVDGEHLVGLATAVAGGLAALHAAGVAHGGLRTDRVRWLADPRVVVALPPPHRWQGLLAEHEAHEAPAALARLAPEQLAGAAPSAAGDVFAWGALVVELATGAPPFAVTGDGPATARRVARERPAGLEAIADARLRHAVVRALAKDAAQRPADGAALCALLEAPRPARIEDRHALGASGPPAQPPPLRPAAKARDWLVAAGGAVAAIALVALIALLAGGRPAPSVELVRLPAPAQTSAAAADGAEAAGQSTWQLVQIVAEPCATIHAERGGEVDGCVPAGALLPSAGHDGEWVAVAAPDGSDGGWVAADDVAPWPDGGRAGDP